MSLEGCTQPAQVARHGWCAHPLEYVSTGASVNRAVKARRSGNKSRSEEAEVFKLRAEPATSLRSLLPAAAWQQNNIRVWTVLYYLKLALVVALWL